MFVSVSSVSSVSYFHFEERMVIHLMLAIIEGLFLNYSTFVTDFLILYLSIYMFQIIRQFNRNIKKEMKNSEKGINLEQLKTKYIKIQDIIARIDVLLSPCSLMLILCLTIDMSSFLFLLLKILFSNSKDFYSFLRIPITNLSISISRLLFICMALDKLNHEVMKS